VAAPGGSFWLSAAFTATKYHKLCVYMHQTHADVNCSVMHAVHEAPVLA
jgi:hypothetical protein